MQHARELILLCLVVLAANCRQAKDNDEEHTSVPPIVDTLRTVFYDIRDAVRYNKPDRFFSYLDPDEYQNLQQLATSRGYTSLASYINRQFRNWPDPDTLSLHEIKRSGDLIRLAFAGAARLTRSDERRLRYTFFLFRKQDEQWKLVAMSDLETPRIDPYGNEMTFHETDLPSKLRFPRQ